MASSSPQQSSGEITPGQRGPEEIKDRLVATFQAFFANEVASTLVLMGATALALVWANSQYAPAYRALWHTELTFSLGPYSIAKTLGHWIDEGLMALFFLIVGLEIKRELLIGELASWRRAALPVTAAVGGMVVPAIMFFLINDDAASARGWAIPMATDIAFALGALAILGRGLPRSLRVFLSALAIADDLGAVAVIALFYQKGIDPAYAYPAVLCVTSLFVLNFFWVRGVLLYAIIGIGLWLSFIGMGLHATVAGIIVALFIPAKGKYDTDRFIAEVGDIMGRFYCPPNGCGRDILLNQEHMNAVQSLELACHNVETPLQRLMHSLHAWVAFAVVPLFALVNAGVSFGDVNLTEALSHSLTIGIAASLAIGKPLGIFIFSWFAVQTGMAAMPMGVRWSHILGAGLLGGIGFTMSLFISGLSFYSDHELYEYSKLGIFLGSLVSGVAGLAFLKALSSKDEQTYGGAP